MKKTLLFFFKMAISGVLAVVILSIFCVFYYNPPVAIPQSQKFTNSKYKSGQKWTFKTEGYGSGTTNSMGYNGNEIDLSKPMIAFLGSSHTEALEVKQNENYVAVLQDRLLSDSDTDNDIQCANFGIAGHSFNICVSNLEYLVNNFDNIKYVVIETASLRFDEDSLDKMINGEYHKDLSSKGRLYYLAQRVPYLRLLYKQYGDLKGNATSSGTFSVDQDAYAEKLDKLMNKLSTICTKKDIKLLIMYHSSVKVDENNVAYRSTDTGLLDIFRECCTQNSVEFIDLTDSFTENYNSTYEMPYGFSNSTLGVGHLNKVGHGIAADEIYKKICETEGK